MPSSPLKKCFAGESATRFVRSRSRIDGISRRYVEIAESALRAEGGDAELADLGRQGPNDFFNGLLGTSPRSILESSEEHRANAIARMRNGCAVGRRPGRSGRWPSPTATSSVGSCRSARPRTRIRDSANPLPPRSPEAIRLGEERAGSPEVTRRGEVRVTVRKPRSGCHPCPRSGVTYVSGLQLGGLRARADRRGDSPTAPT